MLCYQVKEQVTADSTKSETDAMRKSIRQLVRGAEAGDSRAYGGVENGRGA
jgi:hypothetical protein